MSRLRRFILTVGALVLLLSIAGFTLWRSDWLAGQIRARAIAEIEKASGAKVAFGRFDWDWQHSIVRVQDVIIRGREATTDPPFLRIAEAAITLKALTFLTPNVDLRAMRLQRPEIRIITYPDGTTNVPHRERVRQPNEVMEEFIKLGINQLEAENGIFSWDHQEVPFAIHGDNVAVTLSLKTDRYLGSVRGERVKLKLPGLRELPFNLASDVTLESDGVQFQNLRAALGAVQLEADGQLQNWLHPVLTARVKAKGPAEDLVGQFDLPLLSQGSAEASGEVTYRDGWSFAGPVTGKDLGYRNERIHLRGVNVSGDTRYTYSKGAGHQIAVTKLRADSAQGSFRGSATTTGERYRLRGTVGSVQFDDAQHIFDPSLPGWASLVNGPLDLIGGPDSVRVNAHLTLIATDGDRPLSGTVNLLYDSIAQDVQLSNTHLESNSTRVGVSGDLLGGLSVDLKTANLAELPFVSRLPLRIENSGVITFRGVVSGGLKAPAAQGQLTAKLVTYQDQLVETAQTHVDARANRLKLEPFEVIRGGQKASGTLEVSLYDWETRGNSTLRGNISASGIEATALVAAARGHVNGSADLSGTIQEPKLEGNLEWTAAVFDDQPLGVVTGRVTYTSEQVDVRGGRFSIDRQPIEFAGTYVHEPNDLRNGGFQGSAKGSGLFLERLAPFRDRFPLWAGRLEIDGRARGRLTNGQPDFSSIDGRAVVQQGSYDGKALGALSVHAKTEGGRLGITANGLLRGAAVTASSQWQLNGMMPGEGTFELKGAKLDDFQELILGNETSPFEVRLEASGSIRGNLRQPSSLTGRVSISQLQAIPRQAMSESARRDFTLRNDGPVEIGYDTKGFEIKQARLSAKETKLTASGLLAASSTAGTNVRVTGDANLAVLSALKADLLAAGNSTLDVTLRGSPTQPVMAGRMQLRDASFFLRDVPNGLENVNGVVFFDRSRARLENLTAQSGGGNIRLGGFIGFGGELSYQLQAQADNVRVRYPEGVSTAVNSTLTLAGSASRSLLSGSVTLIRAALNPRTDLGAIIAESSKASATPTRIENEFLKNMQFDVRVDTALNAQVTTSLTQNVEAEVNLRLRGTPARPVLLGRTSFTQGEISFFGTKYTIDRGEVNFYNQTKVEPVINLDLQTRVRGVTVTINFSGPASKLSLSYRSDPPLQSSEILALLTVGRTPSGSVAGGANVQSPTFLQGASSALLGQAVAAPLTGRLQRLFGVSRVRIDPQLTGVENTAQARLTIEQQVSRDITVTFITNLNRTQQQIVSVEWDFSREFSALAIRDENGVFGLDFFYRKRFK